MGSLAHVSSLQYQLLLASLFLLHRWLNSLDISVGISPNLEALVSMGAWKKGELFLWSRGVAYMRTLLT